MIKFNIHAILLEKILSVPACRTFACRVLTNLTSEEITYPLALLEAKVYDQIIMNLKKVNDPTMCIEYFFYKDIPIF